MNDTIYKALSKRNFKNYVIESIGETVIVIHDGTGSEASIKLDFDNQILTPSSAEYGMFKYLMKIAAVVINAIGYSDPYDWKVSVDK